MTNAEIDEFLSRCPSPDNGCFAADPNAFDAMLNFSGDGGIRTDLQLVAGASTEAAIAGTPLKDATYEPVKIEVAGQVRDDMSGRMFDYHRLGRGEPQMIVEDVKNDDEIGRLKQRVAKCAYACGATAVGCPLRTPSTDS